MKYSLILVALLGLSACVAAEPATEAKQQVAPAPSNVTVVCPTGSCEKAPEVQKVEVVKPIVPEVQKVEVIAPIELAEKSKEDVLEKENDLIIGVVGQGVAPMNTSSPAQAYALAKRAAVADAYRLIAEKVKGVRIDGQDLIKNMMVKRSTVRTSVKAMVRNANIVETTFKEGLCEVEMEIVLSHSNFAQ
ncbi:MAG: LPP20 family lipoprotein [Campylobacterota bacterium]|nr:LPP20 family lipoprotein [Campylobacterota bacterium]